ncbi:MAG: CPBP family glutamic-type intramembrane protease, partial [Paracoccaceae bacterium]|nr:CPBP family glutamic-type intramembrane protease [Paracoccaceae bacterium]
YARWGFLPAALTSAVLFGAAHIWQGGDYIEAAGVFAITGLGGLLFAWLYAEWHFNIWVPAGVHLLMNLWFQFFAMPDDGSGEIYALAGRLVVFVPAIGLTLWMARRRGHRVVKETVWLRGRPRHSRI